MKNHICEKMMKFFNSKTLASLVAVLCVLVSSVSAAVIDSAVYNTNTNTVTVRGNMQNVPTIKTGGNILLDSACDGTDSVWVARSGGTVASVAESDGSSNNVIKHTERTADYCGIKQDVYTQLTEYGKGYYRISGKVKAETYTGKVKLFKKATIGEVEYDAGAEIENATISKGNVYFKLLLSNITNLSITANDVSEDWVEFSGVVNVDKYGYGDDKTTELDGFSSTNTFINIITDNSVTAQDSQGNTLVDDSGANLAIRDTRNVCIDDITLEKIEYVDIYKGVETARVAVTDVNDNIVYVNETTTNADGDYAISFQLPDGVEAAGLTAKVKGKNIDTAEEAAITSSAVNANIKTIYTGNKVKVTFDIFDFFDSEDYSEVSVIAASYKPDDNMCDVNTQTVNIDLSTASTQTITVDPPTGDVGYVKLFVLNNLNQILPLCTVHKTDVTLTEATLYLVGDSICTAYTADNSEPQAGWGEYIGDYISDKITVYNGAHGGFSTASFMVSDEYRGNWGGHTWNCETVINSTGYEKEATPILPMIKEGDYVIVSLGINDSSIINDPESAKGVTIDDYKGYLKQMAQDTAAKNATMIFVTPSISAYQNSDGTYNLTSSTYVAAMKEVADEIGVVCIELGAKLKELYAKADRDTVEQYHLYNKWLKASEENGGFGLTDEEIAAHSNSAVSAGGDDRIHLSHKGAAFVAKTITDLVADSSCSLSKYVLDSAN